MYDGHISFLKVSALLEELDSFLSLVPEPLGLCPPPAYHDTLKDCPPEYVAADAARSRHHVPESAPLPKEKATHDKGPSSSINWNDSSRFRTKGGKKNKAKNKNKNNGSAKQNESKNDPRPEENETNGADDNSGNAGGGAGGGDDGAGGDGGSGGGDDDDDDDDDWMTGGSKKKNKKKSKKEEKEEEERKRKEEEEEQKRKEEEEQKAKDEELAAQATADLSWADDGNQDDGWAMPTKKKKGKKGKVILAFTI